MTADRIVTLKANLRQTTDEVGIVWHILQTNEGWGVNTGIRGVTEIIAAAPADPEIPEQ